MSQKILENLESMAGIVYGFLLGSALVEHNSSGYCFYVLHGLYNMLWGERAGTCMYDSVFMVECKLVFCLFSLFVLPVNLAALCHCLYHRIMYTGFHL